MSSEGTCGATDPSRFHYPSNSTGRPLLRVLVTTDGVWIGE
jgi:hypothetical protein